jgi:hypothetical protein
MIFSPDSPADITDVLQRNRIIYVSVIKAYPNRSTMDHTSLLFDHMEIVAKLHLCNLQFPSYISTVQ